MPSFEQEDPEIDVEELMAKLREKMAKKQMNEPSLIPLQTPPSAGHPAFSFNWPQLTATMGQMDQHVDVGTQNLPMEKFPRPCRWMARFVGRMVLLMGEVITNPQRKFNHSVLDALRFNVDVIRHLEQRLAEQDRRIAGLEQSLKERDNLMPI